MTEELQRALREVRDTLLDNPVSPRVEAPRDINLHYCRYVAETVADRVDDDLDVEILEDGGRGYAHTWLAHDGRHYDAECIGGVADHRDLPFFRRHPEAAIGVEPESVSPATIRHRGEEPLYPDLFSSGASDGARVERSAYRPFLVAGLLVGLALLAVGLAGEWAVHNHVGGLSPSLGVLFYDLELVGAVVVLVSPVVFYVLLPAHRESPRR